MTRETRHQRATRLVETMEGHQRRAEEADDIADRVAEQGWHGPYVDHWRDKAARFYAAARRVAGMIYPSEVLT